MASAGRFAASIADVAVPDVAPAGLFNRFGTDLPAAWRAHVAYNLDSLDDADPLLELHVYSLDQRPALRQLVRLTGEQEWRYRLTHRDLGPDNVVIDADGRVTLLDWGTAQAGPAPWLDAAQVLRAHLRNNRPTADELAAFLDGAGLPASCRPTLEALAVASPHPRRDAGRCRRQPCGGADGLLLGE